MCKVNVGILYFTPALTAGVLSEYLPRLGIQTTDLLVLSPKVLSIRTPRWYGVCENGSGCVGGQGIEGVHCKRCSRTLTVRQRKDMGR